MAPTTNDMGKLLAKLGMPREYHSHPSAVIKLGKSEFIVHYARFRGELAISGVSGVIMEVLNPRESHAGKIKHAGIHSCDRGLVTYREPTEQEVTQLAGRKLKLDAAAALPEWKILESKIPMQ